MRALARVALIGIAVSFCMFYAGRGARTHASPPTPLPSATQQPAAADTIIQLAKLTSSDGGANDGFGISVAISGDTIVIGSGGHAVGQNAAQGAAYVFVKPSGGWADTSAFTAELTASDGIASDNFGTSVSISGDTIVVGACNISGVCSNGPGKAYVFVKPAGGWASTSTFDAELTPSDGGTAQDSFGLPVSIGGDTVVIGSPQTNGLTGVGPGKAYVYVKPAAGWSSMTETAVLTASDGVNNDGFGPPSASSDGNTVFIGASEATVGANSQQGAAYIYVKPAAGWATTSNFTAKLTASDGQAFDDFGFCQNSVCLSGDGNTVIAGAPQVNFSANQNTGVGKAYIFTKPAAGWATTSTFAAKLTANSPDMFGWSIALNSAGDEAAVSTPIGAGSVFTYSKPSSGWATTSTPDNALTESLGGNLGFSVAIDANDVVAGAFTATAPNSKQGAAFVFGEGQPFSVSADSAVSVSSPGQSGSTTITVSPNGGFTGTVTLSCTPDAAASEADCSFTSGSTSGATLPVDLNGSSATVTFNVTTMGPHSVAALNVVPFAAPGGLVASAIFLLLIPVAHRRRRGTLGLAALACLLILGACGSGGSGGGGGGGHTDPGTPSGNYTFTVTGSSGSGSGAATVSTSVAVAVQ